MEASEYSASVACGDVQNVGEETRDRKVPESAREKIPFESGYFTFFSNLSSTVSESQQDVGIDLNHFGTGDVLQVNYFKRHPPRTETPHHENYQDFQVDKATNDVYIGPSTNACQSSFSSVLDNTKHVSILVIGATGVGKTALSNQLISRLPSLNSFCHVLIFKEFENGREFDSKSTQDTQESIPRQERNSNGDLWLIIFHQCGEDFVDKLPPGSNVRQILERKVLQKSTHLFICEPFQAEQIESIMKVDLHYTLQGFTSLGGEQYLKSHSVHSDEILSYLHRNKLDALCTNPLVCVTLIQMFDIFESPKSLMDFLYKLVSVLVYHRLSREEKAEVGSCNRLRLECLPEMVGAAFDAVCLLAREYMQHGHECVDRVSSQQLLSSFSLKLSAVTLEDVFRFGLVSRSNHSEYAYEFLHPVIMEFLGAFHIFKQPPLNQLDFLYHETLSLFSNDYKLWLEFFCGLVGGDYSKHLSLYNPTKLMVNTVIDVLVNALELNYEADHRYYLIACLFAFQEKSLFRKLSSKHPCVLNFSVPIEEFDSFILPVSAFINKSGFTEWIVSTSSANQFLVANLKKSIVSGVKITPNFDNGIDDERVNLSPKRSSAEVAKMYRDADSSGQNLTEAEKTEMLNKFCCRAVREILQRVLTLYSPVKIKGDATNISYVSFLTCGCFEELFLNHTKFYPLQPIHFLPGPKKNLKRLSSESLTPTDRHNLEKHDGKSNEVVIMLRPLPQKMDGIVPGTDEKFSLLFSHDPLKFQESDATLRSNDFVATQRCFEIYDVNGPQTERILPPLPIVQKTIYGRSQTAYPKPFLPPPQAPKIDTAMGIVSEAGTNTLQIDRSNSDPINPITLAQIHAGSQVILQAGDTQALSSQHLHSDLQRLNRPSPAQALMPSSIQASQGVFVQNIEQAVGEVRVHPATARRQTALRPGTVLYTSMPEKLPSDRIQPLPLQRTLIRKGGNGSIFSENVGGTAMAVKKTSYRSKEYAIITKIRHKNIVPLLAYVWGEEHRENKRRYYVYHYLPKLSGDLARLVTDKEELSLYEFNKIHQYTDFKAVGVAVGNVKYILSQVLQGLQYLHKSHIGHRDLKASNVLIKFFCACSSPIVCGCEVKYQVVLCDFDAAIELDSQDHVPVTPSPPSHPYTGAPPHVEIVPVGTNGFRSPESSMLTIANTPEAFSPPLTTKTDIYSFGILCMRLMISTDTPYSQRTMATLLLHYHQLKGLSEGRISRKLSKFHKLDKETTQSLAGREWPDFLRIDEATVLKILKLKKLRPRMAWLRQGFEFVQQCLSVDPEARPSASDLLKDPFLNSSYS